MTSSPAGLEDAHSTRTIPEEDSGTRAATHYARMEMHRTPASSSSRRRTRETSAPCTPTVEVISQAFPSAGCEHDRFGLKTTKRGPVRASRRLARRSGRLLVAASPRTPCRGGSHRDAALLAGEDQLETRRRPRTSTLERCPTNGRGQNVTLRGAVEQGAPCSSSRTR